MLPCCSGDVRVINYWVTLRDGKSLETRDESDLWRTGWNMDGDQGLSSGSVPPAGLRLLDFPDQTGSDTFCCWLFTGFSMATVKTFPGVMLSGTAGGGWVTSFIRGNFQQGQKHQSGPADQVLIQTIPECQGSQDKHAHRCWTCRFAHITVFTFLHSCTFLLYMYFVVYVLLGAFYFYSFCRYFWRCFTDVCLKRLRAATVKLPELGLIK